MNTVMKKKIIIFCCLISLFVVGYFFKVYYSTNSKWQISNYDQKALQGYASKTSVNPDEVITFYVHSNTNYHISIFRMGFNNGTGGTHIMNTKTIVTQQENTLPTTYTVGANWKPSYTLTVPSNWKSGVYLAKLEDDKSHESYIPFVVKDKNPHAQLCILIASNTYQAYNEWGGKSLYGYNSTDKQAAISVSFHRPYIAGYGAGDFFRYEYSFIRWIDRQNYSTTYMTDQDIHNGLLNHATCKTLVIPGHDEYWTMQMRKNIENATKQKLNIALFNADIADWQIRYHPSNPEIMIGYKVQANNDPYNYTHPELVTTKFRNPPVNMPQNTLFGIMYAGIPKKKFNDLYIVNDKSFLFKGTKLKNGDKIPDISGGEIESYDIKSNIKNVDIIAHAPVILYEKKGFADVTWYTNPYGGHVFSASTFFWNWALDSFGHKHLISENKDIQIITKNVLDAMVK